MRQYKYILLDWDGNLAKTLDLWLEAFRTVTLKRGVVLTDEEITASFGGFTKHMHQLGVEDPDVAMEEADEIVKQKLPYVELYPDALFVLEQLHKRGKHLALITTSSHGHVDHLLEKYDMMKFFEAIITGDDVEHFKPHPEPLEKAMDLLNGDRREAIMVGDTDKDLGAAKNYGIDSILFYPEEHKKFYSLESLKLFNPTHVVTDFKDILDII